MKRNFFIIKKLKNIILYTVFFVFLCSSNVKAIGYPEYEGKNVIDLAGKFDSSYLSRLDSELRQSSDEVRVVFIDTRDKINLTFYAPKLFDKWQMSDTSILVVIDPYLNKIGYGLGSKVKERIKSKLLAKKDNKEPKTEKSVDYDNLATAIHDKFAEEIPRNSEKNNTNSKNNEGSSSASYTSNTENNKAKESFPSQPFDKTPIFIILGILFTIGGVTFLYTKNRDNKRNLELKTNYSFDGNVQQQELEKILEKLEKDLEKASNYKGTTLKELESQIKNLELSHKKGLNFLEKSKTAFQEIELDNLGSIRDLLDDGTSLLDNLDTAHKEAVRTRKELKGIIEKSEMTISDIRVNIEACKNIFDELKLLYSFPLNHSEQQILKCETMLAKSKTFLEQKDPYEFRNMINSIQGELKSIRKSFEVIPHLYKQLKESIPVNVESSINELLLEVGPKNKLKTELNDLKNNALINLSKGELKESEELVSMIFERLNHLKASIK